jgi:hypothetical protein
MRDGKAAEGKGFFEGWGSIATAVSLFFFSGLFLFQLGFFQFIGFGFLGLVGASDLLINTTLILPPIAGVIVGLAMGAEDNKKLLDIAFEAIMLHRMARIILFACYLSVIGYFIFTDPMVGVFVIPSWSVAGFLAAVVAYQWAHLQQINYYRVVALFVFVGFALLTTGYVSARNIVCCSNQLYTIKTKNDELKDTKILRSSDNGVIYSLGDTIAFLAKDEILQVSRARADLGN